MDTHDIDSLGQVVNIRTSERPNEYHHLKRRKDRHPYLHSQAVGERQEHESLINMRMKGDLHEE